MSDIEEKIRELFNNRKRTERLLLLEKARRGLPRNSLVFIGIANIAGYSWCGMGSLFKSKEDEILTFRAYLQDRLQYSLELGRFVKSPKKQKDWLDIGNDITFKEIEQLLKSRSQRFSGSAPRYVEGEEDGIPTLVYADNLSPEDWKSLSKGEDQKLRGQQFHRGKAERYPSIHWNFAWDKYVVGGFPDGITDRFVYEYKTTRNLGLLRYIKPVAHNQADLYGFFFKRDEKRVQVYIVDEERNETWQERVNKNQAETILGKFRRVDAGELPLPPQAWKCKSCEFKVACPIKPPSSTT